MLERPLTQSLNLCCLHFPTKSVVHSLGGIVEIYRELLIIQMLRLHLRLITLDPLSVIEVSLFFKKLSRGFPCVVKVEDEWLGDILIP